MLLLIQLKLVLPLSLKSSTSMISFNKCFGEWLRTLCTVLIRVLHASFVKMMMTDAVGRFLANFWVLHLEYNKNDLNNLFLEITILT